MTQAWPWPGDTALDRARRIANSLLALLPAEEQARHTAVAHQFGETWLGSTLMQWTADDVLPPRQAAELVHAKPELLRKWVQAGVLARTGRGYRVGDVLEAAAAMRRRRLTRHSPGPLRPA